MTGPNSAARLDVDFDSAGVTCRAWLYLPNATTPAPIIVMAHGFGGIREMRLDAFAERFRAAGYACLVFDYRHFGASDGEPRQLLDVQRQLADWAAAIAFARTRHDIDADRIVLWGSSFSGGHVLSAAARDSDIAAVISQCPFTDGVVSVLAIDRPNALRVGMRAVADVALKRLCDDVWEKVGRGLFGCGVHGGGSVVVGHDGAECLCGGVFRAAV
jgi:dienelactone hydrolase